MARPRVRVDPHVFLAACHPDYARERFQFVTAQMVRRALLRSRRRGGPATIGEGLRALAQHLDNDLHADATVARTLIARMEAGDSRAVFVAIRIYGLWDPVFDEAGSADAAASSELSTVLSLAKKGQTLARKAIEGWQEAVERATPKRRARARAYLRRVGLALIPDMRGVRKGRARESQWEIVSCYWREVFRWQQVRLLIRCWRGLQAEKVQAAWDAYRLGELTSEPVGLEREDLLRFCGITSTGELVQPRRVEEIARTVTARSFGITAPRVENILSAWPS
jgi:hypothetical protein